MPPTPTTRYRPGLLSLGLAIVAVVAIACGTSSGDDDENAVDAPGAALTASAPPSATPASLPSTSTPQETPAAAEPTSEKDADLRDDRPSSSELDLAALFPFEDTEESLKARWTQVEGWDTDFDQKTISLLEFTSILPRDSIDPIDDPTFAPASSPPRYMKPREPVIAIEINGDARAYPLAMLMWHEIANDVVGGVPVTVTFCPLCNTAIAFDRTVNGQVMTFGTTGKLRRSDLVMWDRQTQSWWQQITGEAIVGEHAGLGTNLELINSPIIAWETFVQDFPEGQVMERIFDSNGFPVKTYDLAPYQGYDSVDTNPFAFEGELDGRLPANSRVLTLEQGDAAVAYPFNFLEEFPVVNDRVGGSDIVAFFDNGTLSAFFDELDNQLTSGSTTVFSRVLNGRTLTFELTENGIVDEQTGTTWSLTGRGLTGPFAGERLQPVIHANHFWFAWAVFQPDTDIRRSTDDIVGPVSGI